MSPPLPDLMAPYDPLCLWMNRWIMLKSTGSRNWHNRPLFQSMGATAKGPSRCKCLKRPNDNRQHNVWGREICTVLKRCARCANERISADQHTQPGSVNRIHRTFNTFNDCAQVQLHKGLHLLQAFWACVCLTVLGGTARAHRTPDQNGQDFLVPTSKRARRHSICKSHDAYGTGLVHARFRDGSCGPQCSFQ